MKALETKNYVWPCLLWFNICIQQYFSDVVIQTPNSDLLAGIHNIGYRLALHSKPLLVYRCLITSLSSEVHLLMVHWQQNTNKWPSDHESTLPVMPLQALFLILQKIVAAIREMYVSSVRHSSVKVWQTHRQIDRQTDGQTPNKVISMSCYASQATQKSVVLYWSTKIIIKCFITR